MPRKLWGWAAEMMALIATSRSPSVAFLKPTGVERPEAISRWVWDSEVRAPMAVQAIKGVEIGLGFEAARRRGSQVHDPIVYDAAQAGSHKVSEVASEIE